MTLAPTIISGCFQVRFPKHLDARGAFVKAHHNSAFRELGLEADFSESFYTVSKSNVLRGMHLQLPPADGAKLVYCVAGSVMDVALDLRRGSPSFGGFAVIELNAESPVGVYLPRGVAHGFYVHEAPAVIVYHVSSEYSVMLDAGVRWDSFGAPWPARAPLVSPRDAKLPSFAEFSTPFCIEEEVAWTAR